MDMAAELEKLAALRDNGTLTEEEFQKAKTALLEVPPPPPPPPPVAVVTVNANPFDEKTWAMLLHLSQLVFGLIGPAVLWAIKKEESAYVDQHGKNALNWQLTMLIVSMILCFFGFITCGIGFLLFFPLMIPLILFPILAGIKASKGETWKYPCAIEFIK